MKSKTVFILVFFSLLLNIFHDLLIEQQIETKNFTTEISKISVAETSKEVKQTLCDLHDAFHFIAILPLFETDESSCLVSTKLSFINNLSSQNILESSFKPPRS